MYEFYYKSTGIPQRAEAIANPLLHCTDYLSCQQQLGGANLCLVHGNDPTCLWQLGKIMFGTTSWVQSPIILSKHRIDTCTYLFLIIYGLATNRIFQQFWHWAKQTVQSLVLNRLWPALSLLLYKYIAEEYEKKNSIYGTKSWKIFRIYQLKKVSNSKILHVPLEL